MKYDENDWAVQEFAWESTPAAMHNSVRLQELQRQHRELVEAAARATLVPQRLLDGGSTYGAYGAARVELELFLAKFGRLFDA